jgi:hypothetical protein
MHILQNSNDRTTLAMSDRPNEETFYLLTMDASLSQIKFMGDEMTDEEVQSFFRERGMPDHEIAGHIRHARGMKLRSQQG